MKTLFLAQEVYSRFGGIQRFNVRLIDALKELAGANDQFDAAAVVRRDALKDLPADFAPVPIEGCDGSALRFIMSAIRSAWSAQRVVIGHINLLPIALIIKILRPRSRIFLVAHGIEVWGDASFRKYRWWEPMVLRLCVSRVLAVSEYTAKKFCRCTKYPAAQLTIFPNVVDASSSFEEVFPAGVGTEILTVTRLSKSEEKKRVDAVIAAVAELKKMDIDATLHVVGDGDLRPVLVELAEDLGLKSNVIFHGRVSDDELKALYKSADVFVLPSEKEGFGIVYLEAWQAGLPVVAARATAVPEVVDDGINGILVDPVSPSTIGFALRDLIMNGDLRANMVNSGRRKILEKFNHDAFVKRLEVLLNN